MKTIIKKVVIKYGAQMCSLAGLAAIISVNSCRGFFYQPEEPDEVRKLAGKVTENVVRETKESVRNYTLITK